MTSPIIRDRITAYLSNLDDPDISNPIHSTEVAKAFESVDEIVHNQILAVDSDHYDKNLLVEIYKNLWSNLKH